MSVCIWPCTKSERGTRTWVPCTNWDSYVTGLKILGFVGIPLMGHLSRRAINLTLQSRWSLRRRTPKTKCSIKNQPPGINAWRPARRQVLSVERKDTYRNWCPLYDTKLYLVMRSSSRALRGVEYLFIVMTPRSTLTRSGRTSSGPIYGSNKAI